ncbi:MAG: ABC transporter ATP-binding protein/permease [Roseburia sp.]|nr:ABC transporter ATP-binding protein/permease [Roseburia sp.]MCM1243694.1 ABC transporter ATP-binding protein/permease [Roseburia sp.]
MIIKKEISNMKANIFLQILLTVIATTAVSLIPAYNRYLVDSLLTDRTVMIAGLIVAYCVTYIIFLIATWGAERLLWRSAIRFENGLKKKCFEKLTMIKYKDYIKKDQGEYLSMLTNQITQIEQDYLTPVIALLKDMISILIYIFVIARYTNWLICLTLLFLSILAGFSPKFYERRLKKAGKEYVEGLAVYTKKTTDLLNGFELVNARSAVSFRHKNAKTTDTLSEKRQSYGHAKVNGNTISGAVICLIDVLVFALCALLFQQGQITAGIIIAALTYAKAFTEPVQDILYCVNTLNASKDVVKNLEEFLAYQPEPVITMMPSRRIEVHGAKVEYGNKSITYETAFDMDKKYVLIGASGLGKSTLFNILTDQIAYEGSLYIDGQPGKLDENAFFYLSQNQHVFSENFDENVSLFHTYEFDQKSLDKKMQSLNLYGQIKQSKDSTLLSGGEQQLLKMCRAWIQDKKIILLDEPFSAMDKETRRQMIQLLNESKAMILLITHDYSKEQYAGWAEVRIEDIIN